MTALTALLCVALGALIPVTVGAWMVQRGWRQLAVAEAYHEVARTLGLPVDTRGASLRGHLGEQRIWVGEVMVGYGVDRHMLCWAVLDHERPLSLGCMLRPRGLSERLWRRARAPAVPLLDPEFDQAVEVQGDDPEIIRQWLDGPVRMRLLAMLERWRNVIVTDRSVRVHMPRPLSTTPELQELVRDLRELSTTLVEARRALPPPRRLEPFVPVWRQLAARYGLDVEDAFPAATGAVDGRRLFLWPVRTSQGFAAELRVGFRPHRHLGLQLHPQLHAADDDDPTAQDIEVGDDAFDRAFVVKGYDPDRIRDLLTPDARRELLSLEQTTKLNADDVRLHVTNLTLDESALIATIDRAIAAAAAMGW
ncbi:MAG: hypothetical protein AAGA48_07245 [Myxococcota bacterium]